MAASLTQEARVCQGAALSFKLAAMAGLRAIFFDVGNTLLEVVPSVGSVYAEVARRFGVSVEPASLTPQFKVAFQQAPPLCFPGVSMSRLPDAERLWWKAIVEQVLPRDHFQSAKIFADFFNALYETFCDAKRWRVYDDVRTTLETCKSRGVAMGVISNFDTRLHGILAATDLAPYFSQVICSTQAGFAKPDPRIFELAFSPSLPRKSIAMVGDDVQRDIRPVLDLGARAFLVRRQGEIPALAEGAQGLKSLSGLLAHL